MGAARGAPRSMAACTPSCRNRCRSRGQAHHSATAADVEDIWELLPQPRRACCGATALDAEDDEGRRATLIRKPNPWVDILLTFSDTFLDTVKLLIPRDFPGLGKYLAAKFQVSHTPVC